MSDWEGSWFVDFDLSSLVDVMLSVTATLTDEFGNIVSETLLLEKTPEPTFVSIDTPLMVDDIISSTESEAIIVTGTTLLNYPVTVMAWDESGKQVTATTMSNGNGEYYVSLNVASFVDGMVTVTSTVSNDRQVSVASRMLHKDATVTSTTISRPIAGDNVVNSYEKPSVRITGQGEPSSIIEVLIGTGDIIPVEYALVNSEGTWNTVFDMSPLMDGPYIVSAIELDISGNLGRAVTAPFRVESTLPDITINAKIAGDDIINLVERNAVVLSGTSSGTFGDEVTVEVRDGVSTVSWVVPVQVDGTWSVTMDATGLPDGSLNVEASIIDEAGNEISTNRDIIKSTGSIILTIDDPLAGDDVISAVEKQSFGVSGSGQAGLRVTAFITDASSAQVALGTTMVDVNGRWSIPINAESFMDGTYQIRAQEVDAVGNLVSVLHRVSVDSVSSNLSIRTPISQDHVVDGTDNDRVFLSGQGEPGSEITVVLSIDGQQVQVQTTVGPSALWYAVADVTSLPDGIVAVRVSQLDQAGNSETLPNEFFTIDTSDLIVTIFGPISEDDIIDAFEDEVPILIQGTSEAGANVQVIIRDREDRSVFSELVSVDANGGWNVEMSHVDQLAHGPLSVLATAFRAAVEASTTRPVYHDTVIASPITINMPITQDNIINGIEDGAVEITGTAPAGVALTVSVSDGVFTVSTQLNVPLSGEWSTTMDVSTLRDGALTVRAYSPDGGLDVETVQHDMTGPSITLTRPISQDNIVDVSDDYSMKLSGTAPPNAVVELQVVDSAGDVIRVTVTASPAGTFSAVVNVVSLNNGVLTVTASAVGENGNVGRDFAMVLHSPFGVRSGCESLPAARCGNDQCDPSETIVSCPADCVISDCGDGSCGPNENGLVCPDDCNSCADLETCGDTVCQNDENVGSCPSDCAANPPCGNGVCEPEENAGSCSSDCAISPVGCGNGSCNDDENGGNCPEDCSGDNPPSCHNGRCDINENAGNCPEDCAQPACNMDGRCDFWETDEFCSDCDGSCNLDGICDDPEMPSACRDCEDLAQIDVRAFLDANLDGVFDGEDVEVPDVFIYMDWNRNQQFDLYEPIFSTRLRSDGSISTTLPLRPGNYNLGVMHSSLKDLVIGYINVPALEFFSINVEETTQDGTLNLPLSRNLRPVAENIHLTVDPDRSTINVSDLITMKTDPNNNIHLTNGFEMLQFPDELATWRFHEGALEIVRNSLSDKPLVLVYRLCDSSSLCSDPAVISVDYAARPIVAPQAAGPIVYIVTPVPTPVPVPVRIYIQETYDESIYNQVHLDDININSSTESASSSLLVPLYTLFCAFFLSLFF